MTIKTKLLFSILVTVLLVATTSFVIYQKTQQIDQEIKKAAVAKEIVQVATSQRGLILDYYLYHEERPKAQWQSQRDALTKLTQAQGFETPDEQSVLRQINETGELVKSTFAELVANYEKPKSSQAELALSKELEQILFSQLLANIQTNISGTYSLSNSSLVKIKTARDTLVVTDGVSIILILFFLVALYFFFDNFIAKPLTELEEMTVRIASSDFSTTTTTTTTTDRKDELGILSRAFNAMTAKLKVLADEKEDVRKEMATIAETLRIKAEALAVTAEEKEEIRKKLVVTAEEKENVRSKLAVTAKDLKKSYETLEINVDKRTKELVAKEKEFISMASHQLLTPLALMKGYTSMLVSGKIGKVDDEAKKYLGESLQGSERMSNLVKSLLTTSRLEGKKVKMHPSPFDLDELVRSLTLELKPALDDKKLTLKLPIPKKLMVFADLDQTREVLTNVLDNAIKYSKKGNITITESQEGGMGVVRVTDTGIGINQKDLPHIFEKFYSSENWLQAQSESHGLGLYIAELLLKEMGGTISVESVVGKGSVFTISLPLAKN